MPARKYYEKKRPEWLRWTLIAVLTATLLFSGIQLAAYAVQLHRTRALQAQMRSAVATETPVPQPALTAVPLPTDAVAARTGAPMVTPSGAVIARPQPTATLEPWRKPPVLARYQKLHQQNGDLVGYLKIERLYRVDFAVVQRDQSYYLRRDFQGRSNVNGTAFLDQGCSIWPRDDNLIIYAHNMKSGEMFGSLHRMGDTDFVREAPITWFDTIYEQGMYVPIAAFRCSVLQSDSYFPFYRLNFDTPAALEKYISRARELSTLDSPYDVRFGDQLLTLVTCFDEANTERYIVILRKVRSDENADAMAGGW